MADELPGWTELNFKKLEISFRSVKLRVKNPHIYEVGTCTKHTDLIPDQNYQIFQSVYISHVADIATLGTESYNPHQ